MSVNTTPRLTGHVNASRSSQLIGGQANVGIVLKGDPGDPGAVFTPIVDADGNLSWTNDGGLTNPDTINIKGPKGDPGRTIQSDWNQSDAGEPDYIKNKPEVSTDEGAIVLLAELELVTPITTADGKILTDTTGKIYSL